MGTGTLMWRGIRRSSTTSTNKDVNGRPWKKGNVVKRCVQTNGAAISREPNVARQMKMRLKELEQVGPG